jgi:membrane-bound metal-dependent hydrolase YbcI (DUF457 family)
MIFWHLGITLFIARYVFRDPDMDLRLVAAGSLLPDVIDKPLGSILFNGTFETHRLFSHALIFPVILLLGVVLATRRSGALRKALIAVVLGMFVHLLLDAAWVHTEAFLWPFFGWEFPPIPDSAFGPLLRNMVTDPLVWAGEAAGIAYLVFLAVRRLGSREAINGFVRTGKVPLLERAETS